MDMVNFRPDFEFTKQRRKAQGASVWKQHQIAGADFETKDGYPHIFTWSIWNQIEETWEDRSFTFGGTPQEPDLFLEANGGKRYPAFDISLFLELHFQTGHFSEGGHGKRRQPPQMFYFNLQFDAQCVIKTLPDSVIERLFVGDTLIVDRETMQATSSVRRERIPNPNHGKKNKKGKKDKRKTIQAWVLWNDEHTAFEILPFNRFIEISYLPKKYLRIEPIKWYDQGVKYGKVEMWDIRPFLGGGSLNFNAKKHLGEEKIDFSEEEMGLLGSLSPEGVAFSNEHREKILEYAEKDSNLTARLAWKAIKSFEDNGIRMIRPYSPASVAERAAQDLCNIPTINHQWENTPDLVRAFWTGYQGGWFEAVGQGLTTGRAVDITSAYPHVMWWLPCTDEGSWIGSFLGETYEEAWEYLEDFTPYSLSIFEAEVRFPEGLRIYPAAKMSEVHDCLMNPRVVYGFFTGDEIKEFEKWDAEIHIERWCAFIPHNDHEEAEDVEDGVRYPFRPFIKKFYGGKLEQDRLKGTDDYDPERRTIFKLMINSLYGKTIQAIEKEGVRVSGQMFSPFYAAVITGGCRMRCAEIIRLNGDENLISVATDGVIFRDEQPLIIPPNPMPVHFDGERINLGDWEDDGEGTILMMMSGVYSMVKDTISKNTYRGSYSMFLDRRGEDGELITDLYGENWVQFCERYREEVKVSRSEEVNPTMRPYSLGEAKVRGDYSLVNVFRVVDLSIRPCGDSNKRRWLRKPKTFGDLLNQWWDSETWESLI